MKQWVICVLTMLAVPAFAEFDGRVVRAVNGVPTMMVGDLGLIDPLPAESVSERDRELFRLSTTIFLEDLVAANFGADGSESLEVARIRIDYSDKVHVRFDQYLHGLRVMGAQLVVHADASGQVYAINGHFVPAAKVPLPSAAVDAAILESELASIGVLPAEPPELLYFHEAEKGVTSLAWRVRVQGVVDGRAFDDDVYIDARSFQLLLRLWRPRASSL